MPETPTTLEPNTRYLRSVHLQRDFANTRLGVRDYQVTPLVVQTTERIMDGLHAQSTARAFSIIGPYGSGKSAYGVFLAHYLRSNVAMRQQLLAEHSMASVSEVVTHGPSLLPVLVSGNNDSLRRAVLLALHRTLGSIKPLRDGRLRLPQVIAEAATAPDLDPQYVAQLVAEACALVAERTAFRGLTVIIDELGQFLDYAARQDEERDLFVLQTLAEMAARSGETPCMLVTILHQSFERYTATAGATRRAEWAKVQGRFIDLPFQEPPVQMIRMVGHALMPAGTDPFAASRAEWAAKMVDDQACKAIRPPDVSSEEWQQLIARAFPLHPLTLVAVPLLFRQLAQNERSLFAFLTSHEPWSVQDFLHSARTAQAHDQPLYRLPQLYAYVHTTLGASLFGRARGQRWAELAEARAQIPEADGVLVDVLTTIGTLGALGQTHGLRASHAQIHFALRDQYTEPEIDRALQELQARKHIAYRQHRNSYVIWEGSDLDIDGLTQEARRTISDRTALVDLLRQYATPTPLVARRHSYQTGAVRIFDVTFVEASTLTSNLQVTNTADGELLYIVPEDDEALGAAYAWAIHADRVHEPQRVVVLPQRGQELRDLLLDVAALRSILEHQQELEGDRAARREVSSRLSEAEQALTQTLAQNYGPGSSQWFRRGRLEVVRNAKQLDELLSRACDETYHLSPRMWNELIVRRTPSAAATKARRNLIEAMLEHGHQEGLDIEGYPPERAMYASILRGSGMHQQDAEGVWRFGAPSAADPLHLQPTWDAIQGFFDATAPQERPIRELFDQLEAAPYGVKSGVIPLLFMAAYIASIGEMALYEHGNYVPMPDIATFERMLRQTGNFAVRRSQISGARGAVYRHVAQALVPGLLERTPHPAVLDVVTPLFRLIRALPPYSRATRQISTQAQAVRKALLESRSPDELLFTDLPLACGMLPFLAEVTPDQALLDNFFAKLRTSLQELQGAYGVLVEQVREDMRAAFGAVASTSAELRDELTQRYQHIAALGADAQVRSLGVRLESAGAGDAWIESVAALVSHKSLGTWTDDDASQFSLQIKDWGRRFRNVEQMAVASGAVSFLLSTYHTRHDLCANSTNYCSS